MSLTTMRKFSISSLAFTAALTLAACGSEPAETPKAQSDPSSSIETSVETEAANKFLETEVETKGLGGTYLDAGDGAPLVLVVPGSGPTNKDGNGLGFRANSLKFLAENLAEQGISTIRVDKRGMFSSTQAGDANDVTVDIYAQDYRNWADFALGETGLDCVYLAGHSEGGLMVTAAATGQDNICGVILIASPGYRLSDVLRKQLKANPANAPILDEALTAIDTLEAGNSVDKEGMHPALMGLFRPAVQPYMISLFQADPALMLGELSIPKLVIQGSHDIQVDVDDAQRLAKTGGAELVILDGINHVLKPAPKDRFGNITTYNSPVTPIDSGVANAIANFVKRN